MQYLCRVLLSGFSLAILAACGGGGGDDIGAPPVIGLPTTVHITAANAAVVGGVSLDAAQSITTSAGVANLVAGVEVDAAGVQVPSYGTVVQALVRHARPQPSAVTGVEVAETVSCSLGGRVVVFGDVASSSGLFPGDYVGIEATNCVESLAGVTSTITGIVTMSVLSGSLTSAVPYRVVLETRASGFSVTAGGVTSTSNGVMTLDLSGTAASQTTVASGTSFTHRVGTDMAVRFMTLRNFTQTATVTGTSITGSFAGTVEAGNTRLGAGGGSVAVTTPTTLAWDSATGAITAGSLRIVGASNSTLVLTVTGTNTVQLQVDANGDGTFESTSTAPLAQLRALL